MVYMVYMVYNCVYYCETYLTHIPIYPYTHTYRGRERRRLRRCKLHVICHMSYVIYFMLYVVCYMSFNAILLCHTLYLSFNAILLCHTLFLSFNAILLLYFYVICHMSFNANLLLYFCLLMLFYSIYVFYVF
jgi:hypothetical protein